MSATHIDTELAAQNAYTLGSRLHDVLARHRAFKENNQAELPDRSDYAKVLLMVFVKDMPDGPSLEQRILAVHFVINHVAQLVASPWDTKEKIILGKAIENEESYDLAVFLQDKIEDEARLIQRKALELELSVLDGSLAKKNARGLLGFKIRADEERDSSNEETQGPSIDHESDSDLSFARLVREKREERERTEELMRKAYSRGRENK